MTIARRTETIGIRVAPEVKSAITAAAADVNRSVGSLIETMLIDHLATLGYLEADQIDLGLSVSDQVSVSQDDEYEIRAARGNSK